MTARDLSPQAGLLWRVTIERVADPETDALRAAGYRGAEGGGAHIIEISASVLAREVPSCLTCGLIGCILRRSTVPLGCLR
jgi:hypothetical protein